MIVLKSYTENIQKWKTETENRHVKSLRTKFRIKPKW